MILGMIPLAISGVFIIFGLSGTPLSFPALIGVMALFGIVVTNAMFIVEKINQNRAHGMALEAAIADAGKSRLEPILLTSLTSILGLVPITIANPLWRGLGGAIISGLMFSGIIMLFFIPVMYYFIYRKPNK
jgi:multidrug efflux pump subunit AcrB